MDKDDIQWLISVLVPIIIYMLDRFDRKPKKKKPQSKRRKRKR